MAASSLELGAAIVTMGDKMAGSTRGRHRDDRGATAAEYALLVALIAMVIIGSVTAMGTGTLGLYQNSCSKIAAATTTGSC